MFMMGGRGGAMAVRVGASAPAAGIPGTSGVWVDVSPPWLPLDEGGNFFGAMDMLGPPGGPFYFFTCYHGVGKSTDFGDTWTQITASNGPSDFGKAWAGLMPPSASYILSASGDNSQGNSAKVFKSIDGAVTWTLSANLTDDPYSFSVDPSDETHVICTFHGSPNLAESADAGATFTDRGDTGCGVSPYVHFITSTTILAVSQEGGGNAGTRRGVWNGSAWGYTAVGTQAHWHGAHQIVNDIANGLIFSPGTNGVDKSSDGGVNWTNVSGQAAVVVAATSSTLYAGVGYPISSGTYAPHIQQAARPAGTAWSGDVNTMLNGPKTWVPISDGTRNGIMGGHWNKGVWRYVE